MPQQPLANSLARIRDRLQTIGDRLGLPDYQYKVTLSSPDGLLSKVIQPTPRVSQVSRRSVGSWLSSSVQLMGDEVVLTGIPRRWYDQDLVAHGYPEEELVGWVWTLEGQVDPLRSSQTYTCVWLDRSKPDSWIVYLAPRTAAVDSPGGLGKGLYRQT